MHFHPLAQQISPLAFIHEHGILNENSKPIEFTDHFYMLEPYADMAPEQAIMKAAQCGWSVLAIIKALWMAKFLKANLIYTLPSKSIVKDFVTPKVDPIINNNKVFTDMVGKTDSIALKSIGDRFLYLRGCFDDQTEVLTGEGWKSYGDIGVGDTVLNIEMETGKIVSDIVKEVFVYEVAENLHKFESIHLNLLVTSDHRMVIKKHETAKLSFIKAGDLVSNDKRHIPTAFKAYENLSQLDITTGWAELVGWVIGDGSYWIENYKHRFIRKDGTTNPHNLVYERVVIIQKNKKERLRSFLLENGFSYYEKDKGNGVVGFELSRKVSKVMRRICPEKRLTQELVLSLNKEQRTGLYKGLMASDGSKGNVWYQAEREESEAFQLLAFLLGRNASINKRTNKGGFSADSVDYPVYIKSSENTYQVNSEKQYYEGNVWCVRTNNGTVITRRKDKICVSGNSWEESAAISISAHILINDELDRSNQSVLNIYRSRLDDALRERPDLGFIWQFSNPSIPGFGVSERWELSDKKHWFVKCSHCNQRQYLSWPESINLKTKQYVCKKCGGILTHDDRRNGEWVKKHNDRSISGYWISQLFMPWINAAKIIEDSKRDTTTFYNFTLGLPYVPQDQKIDRKTITDCISPDRNPLTGVAIGVDNGVKKTVVIGNAYGIFKIYETDSWEDIEEDIKKFHAVCVIDALPYPTTPEALAKKYRGRVFVHYFVQNRKNLEVIEWGEGDKIRVVESDRTKIIDMVVSELIAKQILFNLTVTQLEQYIYDWTQLYRVVEENAKGIQVPAWRTIEGRRDHGVFATIYWRIALEKTFSGGGVLRAENKSDNIRIQPLIGPDRTMPAIDLNEVVKRATTGRKDWRT